MFRLSIFMIRSTALLFTWPETMARFVLDQVISTRSATFRERHRRCAFRRRVPVLYSKRKYFPPPKQMLLKIRVYARQWNSYYIRNYKYQKISKSKFLLKTASGIPGIFCSPQNELQDTQGVDPSVGSKTPWQIFRYKLSKKVERQITQTHRHTHTDTQTAIHWKASYMKNRWKQQRAAAFCQNICVQLYNLSS